MIFEAPSMPAVQVDTSDGCSQGTNSSAMITSLPLQCVALSMAVMDEKTWSQKDWCIKTVVLVQQFTRENSIDWIH